MKHIAAYLFILIALSGCNNITTHPNSKVLARVHDKYLYLDDIRSTIPRGISVRDSISMLRNIVNDWVKTNVMIYQAKKNLPSEQLDFSKQLDEYKNSLIIYTYETNLIDQNLDTIVSEKEILDYYNAHLSDFELKENIAKVAYIVIENNFEIESQLDTIFSLNDSIIIDSLESITEIYGITYNTDTSIWIPYFDIQKIIPIETYNIEHFLNNNRYVKIETDRYVYYALFFDFKIKDDISPLAFKSADIRNIIISKRKVQLVKEVRKDIFNRASESNEFEIFYND